MTAPAPIRCAKLGCPASAVVTYAAGPLNDPYRTASACRRHRAPIRAWVTDAGRIRRTPAQPTAGAAA